jgi:hypothetical protein
MNSWTVLLQLEGVSARFNYSCERYPVSGVALPAQIFIVACDSAAEGSAQSVHGEIEIRLSRLRGNSENCGGPRGLGCIAWGEPSCRHILVLLIGNSPLDPKYERLAHDWLQRGGSKAVVVPALVGGISHAQVFGNNAYPTLSHCNLAAWGGSPSRLVEIVLSAALIDEKPGVFISYLRKESSAGAEQIHDALIRAGFRVFLDRFSGTPGRLFPQELAEAMANMGLVVLLETPGLSSSRWTMWEAAFSRRYRIGPIAVNFIGARRLRSVTERHVVVDDPAQALPNTVVDAILKFVQDEYLKIAVGRRVYYETLIRLAAQSKGGDVRAVGSGVLEILDGGNNTKGFVLPSGAPGQLKHVRRLVETATSGQPLLAGEHQHLSPSDRSDLEWLATQEQVKLAGSASIYRIMRSII